MTLGRRKDRYTLACMHKREVARLRSTVEAFRAILEVANASLLVTYGRYVECESLVADIESAADCLEAAQEEWIPGCIRQRRMLFGKRRG